ncbi:MAG TPA: glycosyltransferase family 39 protein [Thermoanaerobaculia bacterium]
MTETPVGRWEWLSLAIVAVLFAGLRVPLFTAPGLLLGWNSDAALFGLMARAMRSGTDFPLFFWGQFYLGTLTSMLAAAVSVVLPAQEIGPLAVRLAAAVELATAIAFYWLALRRMFGPTPAMVAAAGLVAGPSFVFFFTTAAIGNELFVIAAVMLWYFTRATFLRRGEWFVAGLLCGVAMWLHQGAVFLIAATAVALIVERRLTIRNVALAVAGAAIGYLPTLLSLLRNDPLLYTRTTAGWSVAHILDNLVETARSDLWLLFADSSIVGIATTLCLLFLATIGLRASPSSRAKTIAILTLAFSAAFYLFTTYPYPGAVRYISPVVPLVYGFAAYGVTVWRQAAGARGALAVGLTAVIAAGLYLPRYREARAVAAGRSEQYSNWPGAFDPRPVLAELRRGRYAVCYGEVWVAHKLEFLSDPTVRFAVVRSVHRTLAQSLTFIDRPGPKCFVENSGSVRALDAEEERMWAGAVRLRAEKMRRAAPKPWWQRLF